MKNVSLRLSPAWRLSFLLWLAASLQLRAGDPIKSAGDILQLVLPATAGGLTLAYQPCRSQGALSA